MTKGFVSKLKQQKIIDKSMFLTFLRLLWPHNPIEKNFYPRRVWKVPNTGILEHGQVSSQIITLRLL